MENLPTGVLEMPAAPQAFSTGSASPASRVMGLSTT